MEIIIFVAVVVGVALVWSNYLKKEKAKTDNAIDNWTPPKEMTSSEKEWPFPGAKVGEGTIHESVADVAPVAPTDSENRVEALAPVVESAPAKKPAAKKTAAKPAAAKKAPAKKKSV